MKRCSARWLDWFAWKPTMQLILCQFPTNFLSNSLGFQVSHSHSSIYRNPPFPSNTCQDELLLHMLLCRLDKSRAVWRTPRLPWNGRLVAFKKVDHRLTYHSVWNADRRRRVRSTLLDRERRAPGRVATPPDTIEVRRSSRWREAQCDTAWPFRRRYDAWWSRTCASCTAASSRLCIDPGTFGLLWRTLLNGSSSQARFPWRSRRSGDSSSFEVSPVRILTLAAVPPIAERNRAENTWNVSLSKKNLEIISGMNKKQDNKAYLELLWYRFIHWRR